MGNRRVSALAEIINVKRVKNDTSVPLTDTSRKIVLFQTTMSALSH